jgi:hypothetical protein
MSALAQFVDCLTETSVRLLKPGEHVPLDIGFTNPDPDWTWVQLENGEMTAALLACPCHGMVQLVRLIGRASTRLLRQCIRNCNDRGHSGFMVWLDENVPSEKRLLRILTRAGAVVYPSNSKCVGIGSAQLGRW